MWYMAGALLLLAATGAIGLGRSGSKSVRGFQVLERMMDRAALGSLSMQQVNALLARLELREPPEPVMGAMCYEAMAYPAVAEYVCPVCGEKTLYEDTHTGFIEWELPGCRRMAESVNALTEFEIILDETMFCRFCSEGAEEDPGLLLRVVSSDSGETVNAVSIPDLRMLESFLQGHLYYVTANDAQMPLREHSERISELLGAPVAP